MKKALILFVCFCFAGFALAQDSSLYTYSWNKNNDAVYYEGRYSWQSKTLRFWTKDHKVLSPNSMGTVTIQAYNAKRKAIGAPFQVEALEVEIPAPVPEEESQPVVQTPPVEEEVNDEPEPIKDFERPFVVSLYGTLGKESLSAEGGYGKFSGSPVVGGLAISMLLQRPKQSDLTPWSYLLTYDMHRFSFDLEDKKIQEPGKNTTIKETFNRMWTSAFVRYAMIGNSPLDDLNFGLGLTYGQVAYLEITNASQGESRLRTRKTLSPAMYIDKGIMLNGDFGLGFGAQVAGLQLLKSGDQLTTLQAEARGLYLIDAETMIETGLKFHSDSLKTKVTCPAEDGSNIPCTNTSSSKSSAILGFLGLKRYF